ncbi:MAG: LAGLIDADG family homing endonuclease [Candidatus Nanoarchaeia archaeon]|nr:LAGLIDADG family homing endonuclease [Candidatus Nanoarchaeia archaeon]MDD5740957.1 LAGLIDADG family homing endonuclease [Candidatus Nanoarchaeia archaeon]
MILTEGIAELIGVIIGDGYIYRKNRKYQIGIVGSPKNDKEYFEKLKKLIYEEWDKKVKIKFRFRGLRMVFDSKRICEFLIDDMKMFHGKGKCQNIKIPEEIYKNWDLARHTIRGIADTDGSVFVSKKPGIEKYPSIEITTTSQNLANQLNQILIKRGFRVSLRENVRKQINALKAYKIALYGKKNLKKWIEEIGFTNPYKLNRALNYLKN